MHYTGPKWQSHFQVNSYLVFFGQIHSDHSCVNPALQWMFHHFPIGDGKFPMLDCLRVPWNVNMSKLRTVMFGANWRMQDTLAQLLGKKSLVVWMFVLRFAVRSDRSDRSFWSYKIEVLDYNKWRGFGHISLDQKARNHRSQQLSILSNFFFESHAVLFTVSIQNRVCCSSRLSSSLLIYLYIVLTWSPGTDERLTCVFFVLQGVVPEAAWLNFLSSVWFAI